MAGQASDRVRDSAAAATLTARQLVMQTSNKDAALSEATSQTGNHSNGRSTTRKSARLKPTRNKVQTTVKALATKGRSRRVTFKKNVRLLNA